MSQNEDGSFVIDEPAQYVLGGARVNITDGRLTCNYRELGGALLPNIHNYTFVGGWKPLPLNRHFFLDVSMFVVKCFVDRKMSGFGTSLPL